MGKLSGGCLCGAVRYTLEIGGAEVADYCHCSQCRKAGGAPVLAWVQLPPEHFIVTQGAAKAFASSDRATRWFCGDCGSPLYMTDTENRSIGVTLGTLDDTDAVTPTVHGWTSAQLRWLHIADILPRYPESPPYDL